MDSCKHFVTLSTTVSVQVSVLLASVLQTQKMLRVQRRGAAAALTAIASLLGPHLSSKLPKLWQVMVSHLQAAVSPSACGESLQTILSQTSTVESLISHPWATLLGQSKSKVEVFLTRLPSTQLQQELHCVLFSR